MTSMTRYGFGGLFCVRFVVLGPMHIVRDPLKSQVF